MVTVKYNRQTGYKTFATPPERIPLVTNTFLYQTYLGVALVLGYLGYIFLI